MAWDCSRAGPAVAAACSAHPESRRVERRSRHARYGSAAEDWWGMQARLPRMAARLDCDRRRPRSATRRWTSAPPSWPRSPTACRRSPATATLADEASAAASRLRPAGPALGRAPGDRRRGPRAISQRHDHRRREGAGARCRACSSSSPPPRAGSWPRRGSRRWPTACCSSCRPGAPSRSRVICRATSSPTGSSWRRGRTCEPSACWGRRPGGWRRGWPRRGDTR